MLEVVKPDERDRRVKVGMILRDVPNLELFEVWDEWLNQCDDYKHMQRKARRAWESFGRTGGNRVGMGTLRMWADQADPEWRQRYEDSLRQESDDDDKSNPGSDDNNSEQAETNERKYVVTVRASQVVMRSKQWLWEGHLLRGAQEILSGIPGLGKSQVQCHYVACATNRQPWPDGTTIEPVSVLMVTAEDTLDQEVVPRLIAAKANLERVHFLKCVRVDNKNRQFLLSEDIEDMERKLREIGDAALVTIDPITAYMGGKMDSHRTTEVRSQLGPLKDFAERVNAAVSTITHPAKSTSQRAIDQFIGSQAFIAAARIGHVCIEEIREDDISGNTIKTGRVLFCHAKHNSSLKMPTWAFRVQSVIVGQDPETGKNIEAPYVVWDKEPVEMTADEAVAAAAGAQRQDGRSQIQNKVQAFLREILGNGAVPERDIEEEGARRGFTIDQLKKAKKKLGIVSSKDGAGPWFWELGPF